MNNWLIILCSIVGIAAGALYNTSYAVEDKMVTAGLYKIEGDKRTLIKEIRGITESDCIARSREIAGFKFEGGHLEVVCKRTKTFKKSDSNRGVSFP